MKQESTIIDVFQRESWDLDRNHETCLHTGKSVKAEGLKKAVEALANTLNY